MTEIKTSNRLTLTIIVSVVSLIIGFLSGVIYNETKSKTNGVMLSSGPELEKIQTVTNEFVEAWIKGDAEGCANTYSLDAVFMTPDQPSYHGDSYVMVGLTCLAKASKPRSSQAPKLLCLGSLSMTIHDLKSGFDSLNLTS